MIITTARKPSPKTRIFCKHLGRFLGWRYITRGKTSLLDLSEKPFLLIGEYKGNPGSLNFFFGGRCVLSIRANVSLDTEIGAGAEPVIKGNNSLAHDISRVTGLRKDINSRRIINIDENMEFSEDGKSYIKLTVLDVRVENSV